jgi:hypothetical protein
MKFPAVIAIAIIAVVVSLAMVDAEPILTCRAPQRLLELCDALERCLEKRAETQERYLKN